MTLSEKRAFQYFMTYISTANSNDPSLEYWRVLKYACDITVCVASGKIHYLRIILETDPRDLAYIQCEKLFGIDLEQPR